MSIDEKAFKAAKHVYNASIHTDNDHDSALRCAIIAYEHVITNDQPDECAGVYSPEFLEQYLFGGKAIDHLVDGGTYNLTGTHLKDILQGYRKLWNAKAPEREYSLGWQPIETAPKDGTEILLFSITDIGLCYWRDDNVMTGWTWGLGKAFRLPSHWMPLPAKPVLTKPTSIEDEAIK